MIDVTVVILTYNEALHLARAIASVSEFATEVVVVDSFSSDDTVAIARAAGARVLQNRFVSQSRQFQWALDNAGIATAWILRLDADEVIKSDLAATIAERLPALPISVAGVTFARKHIFMGRWVKHGGRYPLIMVRLWRNGQGRVEDRWMDEHVIVWGGETVHFAGGFADDNLHDLGFFTDKHNRYATREAVEVLGRKYGLIASDDGLDAGSASRQAHLKRLLKERVYNRLPLWMGPLGYFIYRAVILGGFLDGRSGMIYHVLQGFWYRYLVNAKVFEFERALAPLHTADKRREMLSKLTGLTLAPPSPDR